MSRQINDLTGQTFGNRRVLRMAEKSSNMNDHKTYWECICNNGHITRTSGNSLVSGRSNFCTKCFSGKDETNKIYGMWKVIELDLEKSKDGIGYWKCECLGCGRICTISGATLRNSKSTKCRHCASKGKNSLEFGEAACNALYLKYKYGANARGLSFDIDKKYFMELTKQKCYYCGTEPYQVYIQKTNNGEYIYNGVDRKNSHIGYSNSNCVACCGKCNRIKGEMLETDFLTWIGEIYRNRCLKIKNDDCYNESPINDTFILPCCEKYFYWTYKRNAKSRNKEFSLPFDFFVKEIRKPCFYCGSKSDLHTYYRHTYYCNGIDRIDNSYDYVTDNCVPCCHQCNRAKSEMSQEEFYTCVENVFINQFHKYSILPLDK